MAKYIFEIDIYYTLFISIKFNNIAKNNIHKKKFKREQKFALFESSESICEISF